MGYKNVRTFKAGIPGWVAAGYELDTSKAVPKVKIPTVTSRQLDETRGNAVVVDLRVDLSRSKMGKFPNAIHIPLDQLMTRYREIPEDNPIVLVDYSGVEFPAAGHFLIHKGYGDVKGLQGGLLDWINQGFKLEK